jgi:short-subunit dehydrogenase
MEQSILILSGRKEQNLRQVAEGLAAECFILPLDITDEHAVNNAVSEVLGKYGKVDKLINNAGLSQRSLARDTNLVVGRAIMDVNFFGAVHLTKALLPQFLKNRQGDIVVISSLSGEFGFPLRSFYAASKHALHGYFETLGLELYQTGINVLIVCPGRVQTEISLNALTGDGQRQGTMDRGQREGISPKRCARKIKGAIRRKKKIIYIGKSDVLMVYFKRYFPGIFRFLAARIDPS